MSPLGLMHVAVIRKDVLSGTVEQLKRTTMLPNQFSDIWEVTPETAHPRARQLLPDSIVWDYGDEDSPLGNDTGADTFAGYLAFRAAQPTAPAQQFICSQLASSEIADADWDLLDPARLQTALHADDGFTLLTRDDFIIG